MQLKRMMTFDEMASHLKEHSFKLPGRINVGKYARELGFDVYKPMVRGKILFFYVNNNIPADNDGKQEK